jgi:hypothetical protein
METKVGTATFQPKSSSSLLSVGGKADEEDNEGRKKERKERKKMG